jgi:hypothetical protein
MWKKYSLCCRWVRRWRSAGKKQYYFNTEATEKEQRLSVFSVASVLNSSLQYKTENPESQTGRELLRRNIQRESFCAGPVPEAGFLVVLQALFQPLFNRSCKKIKN